MGSRPLSSVMWLVLEELGAEVVVAVTGICSLAAVVVVMVLPLEGAVY